MKRTLGNSRLKRTRKSGFRARNKSKVGKKVLKKRRLRGRKRIAL